MEAAELEAEPGCGETMLSCPVWSVHLALLCHLLPSPCLAAITLGSGFPGLPYLRIT